MRFSLNFVREFIRVDISPKELASLLTAAGMEVERLEREGSDWIFDIEVTANRYDWLSILGISREISAVLGKKLKVKYPALAKEYLLKTRNIFIEDRRDCPYYIGRRIEGIKVSGSKPWLRERILNCGLTSVNEIVDITNYSMLKWGNPLHAFDADKIEGDIYIRRARKNESLLGIDGKERILNEENLVIADSRKVIALAGIMGGKETEVTEITKNIFLEAALFSPLTVRRSRRSAGLDTESSYRFERIVPPYLLEYASSEAAVLIAGLGRGKNKGCRRAGKKPRLAERNIAVNLDSLEDYLGVTPLKSEVKKILGNLGFKVKEKNLPKGRLVVSPPRFRFDVKSDVDVYEEFSRIYGYDKISDRIPFLRKNPDVSRQAGYYHFKERLADFLSLLGFQEIITYSLEEKGGFIITPSVETTDKVVNNNVVGLVNPLRSQENALRSNLFLGMAKSLRNNLNRALIGTSVLSGPENQNSLRLFEIADTYSKNSRGFSETPTLGLVVSGKESDFFWLKGAIERILDFLNIGGFEFVECSLSNFTNALNINVGNYNLGFLGKLDQRQKKNFDFKEDLFFTQLDLPSCAVRSEPKSYKHFSLYPAVWRDISIALKKSIKFEAVERVVRSKGNYLAGLSIVDIYKGKDVPPGFKAFTLRLFYQSQDKTLVSDEVDHFHNQIRESLSRQEGVILR